MISRHAVSDQASVGALLTMFYNFVCIVAMTSMFRDSAEAISRMHDGSLGAVMVCSVSLPVILIHSAESISSFFPFPTERLRR